MSLIDLLMGAPPEQPEPYDYRRDPRARASEDERRKLSTHVDNCVIRQVEIKQMFSATRLERYHDRMERYRDRKWLLTIVGLLIANVVGARELVALLLP